MSFAATNLSVLAYAQHFTLWHYRAPNGRLADVSAPDFFADAVDMVAQGDIMLISAADGGRIMFASPQSGELRMTPMG